MTKKLFKGIFLTSLATMLACVVLIIGVIYGYYDNRLKTELEDKAIYISQAVEKSGTEYFENMGRVEDRVTLIDGSGEVLYDNRADKTKMENHSDREEFIEAEKDGVGESSRYSNTLSEKTYYYALRLSNGSVLRVSSDRYTVWSLLLSVLQPICIIIILVVVLSAVLSSSVSKNILKPINAIDLDKPDVPESYEEIAPLLEKISSQNRRIAHQMRELENRQQEFTVISDNMSEGLLIIDSRGDVLSYNRSVERFFELSGDVTGCNALTIYRGEAFRKIVDEVLSDKHSAEIAEIGERYYEFIANPVFVQEQGENQKPIGAVILIVDVTERESREKLRHEFTSNVSHELKTPLTSIYGVSDMMMSGMVKKQDIKEFASDIHNEAGRLIHLVDDIIKLSQLDEDEIPLESEPVDLYELVKSAISGLKNIAESRKIWMELSGEHAKITGIRDILYEMVYNLCDNAIKYNNDGGKVKVSVEQKNDEVILSVEDNGIGIPKEHLDRVFERFYRVDKSHSKKIGGTGLGLSIVKHAALRHGGSISIESTVDVGTKITATFKVN